MDKRVKLTEHFTLGEMIRSASHPEINNMPPLDVIDNLRKVCEWLEELRAAYNRRYVIRGNENDSRCEVRGARYEVCFRGYGGTVVRGCENSSSAEGDLDSAIDSADKLSSHLAPRTSNLGSDRTHEQPILINSGYRCKTLNNAIGGALRSNHLTGCAVDINCPGKTANERAKMALRYAMLLVEIAEVRKERFDELIIERRGTNWWVHFAVRPDANRMWITVINKT